jgi:hypothetical protein
MPLFGDILQANFFDLKNSINRQIGLVFLSSLPNFVLPAV